MAAKRTGLLADRNGKKNGKGKKDKSAIGKLGGKTAKTIRAQQEASREAAAFNRVGQQGPMGSMVFDPATNSWKTELGASGQGLQSWLQGSQEAALSGMGQPVDYSGITELFGGQSQEDFMQNQYQQMYDRFSRQNEPMFAQQMESFEQQMADRGIPMGSEMYNREKSRLEQNQQNQRQDMQAQAWSQANEFGNTQFGQSMQGRQQGISEYNARREQPYQEWSGVNQDLLASMPGFQTPQGSSMETPDVAGTAMGYAGLQNQRWLNEHQHTGSGGGAQGYQPWTAEQWADRERQMDMQARYTGTGPYAQSGNRSSPYSSAIAGFTSGLGQGLGSAF